ncbi:MAG: sigma-70 family RNA polymerase sigma factor [Actinobacteria bacterium]|nr:sigma-70 family RNA polymerase sigma factor [Actinomycetota bacterium]
MTEDELFAQLYPGLRRFAAATAPREVDPDDLVQEAVYRALRRHPLSEYTDPGAYLRRAIVNLASNTRRWLGRTRRALARLTPVEAVDPDYPSEMQALLALPPVARAVLYLVEVEGWSFAEVATELQMSEPAARARASRARRQLRSLFADDARGEDA